MIRRIAVIVAVLGVAAGSGAAVPAQAAQPQAAAACVAATRGDTYEWTNIDVLMPLIYHFDSLSEAPQYNSKCITQIYRHREGNFQYSWISNIGRHRWSRSLFGEYKYFYQIYEAQGDWENNLWIEGSGLVWCADDPSACSSS